MNWLFCLKSDQQTKNESYVGLNPSTEQSSSHQGHLFDSVVHHAEFFHSYGQTRKNLIWNEFLIRFVESELTLDLCVNLHVLICSCFFCLCFCCSFLPLCDVYPLSRADRLDVSVFVSSSSRPLPQFLDDLNAVLVSQMFFRSNFYSYATELPRLLQSADWPSAQLVPFITSNVYI